MQIENLHKFLKNLTFVGLCIVVHFYSKTNQMHAVSNLFYFGTTVYTFRTVSPSVISSLMYSLRLLMMDGETVRNM